MIRWTLTLSGHQIMMLKMLAPRVRGKHDKADPVWARLSDHAYIAGIKSLERMALVESYARPDRYMRGDDDGTLYGPFLTPRGRFVLEMVEKDIDHFLAPDIGQFFRDLQTQTALEIAEEERQERRLVQQREKENKKRLAAVDARIAKRRMAKASRRGRRAGVA